jgi:hypothetical protein
MRSSCVPWAIGSLQVESEQKMQTGFRLIIQNRSK